MNRLQNTIKENCAGEESCTANILCKANTLFVTPTPCCKDRQQWTVLLYLWHITMDSTSRVTSPDTQGLPTNPLGMGSWVNERDHGRGTAMPPIAALYAIIITKMQPLEAFPGSLLENFWWHCTLIHNEVGPLTHLLNPVFFSLTVRKVKILY